MKCFFLIFSVVVGFFSYAQTEEVLFVGTYTDGESEGIYKLTFNNKTGELSNLNVVAKTENPSYLAISPDKNYIYAVNETNDFEGKNSGSVSAFKIENNNILKFINKVSSEGAHPCHITIDEFGKNAAVSNYTGGTLSILPINKNGGLIKAGQVFNHNENNRVAHVHSSKFFKNQLFVADLGRDAIFEYLRKGSTYKLMRSYTISILKG